MSRQVLEMKRALGLTPKAVKPKAYELTKKLHYGNSIIQSMATANPYRSLVRESGLSIPV